MDFESKYRAQVIVLKRALQEKNEAIRKLTELSKPVATLASDMEAALELSSQPLANISSDSSATALLQHYSSLLALEVASKNTMATYDAILTQLKGISFHQEVDVPKPFDASLYKRAICFLLLQLSDCTDKQSDRFPQSLAYLEGIRTSASARKRPTSALTTGLNVLNALARPESHQANELQPVPSAPIQVCEVGSQCDLESPRAECPEIHLEDQSLMATRLRQYAETIQALAGDLKPLGRTP
ncbi:hypothetical protein HDU91_007293 [Kappamyces sp. JEL0680]|nr:hypothetical protein HDU91_007293 [Kappamyces sp. JEL0680]